MTGFGLAVGLVFPPFVVLLGVPSARAFSGLFFSATVFAGLLVGAANYALTRLVVGRRLVALAERMRETEAAVVDGADGLAQHALPVDSGDELGDCAQSFNHLLGALERSRAEERRLSREDELTGLVNRRHGLNVLEDELVRSRGDEHVGVLLLDVDQFKWINDLHGHLVGDEALRCVAAEAQAAVRSTDLVCRYGGDEIFVILPDCAPQTLELVGERLRARVAAREFSAGGSPISLTVSVGGAIATTVPAAVAELIGRADLALYRSKTEGRNLLTIAA